jgi:hypothetical protein
MPRPIEGENNALNHYIDYTVAPRAVTSAQAALTQTAGDSGAAFATYLLSDLLPHRSEFSIIAEAQAGAITAGSAPTFSLHWAFSDSETWTAAQLAQSADSVGGSLPTQANGKALCYSYPFLGAGPYLHAWVNYGAISSGASITATVYVNRI